VPIFTGYGVSITAARAGAQLLATILMPFCEAGHRAIALPEQRLAAGWRRLGRVSQDSLCRNECIRVQDMGLR
jgi:hypothetical protein